MKIRYALATAAIIAATTPALSAEFYVVQDTGTKKCTIVEKKPTVSTMVVVGGDKVYATRVEAEGATKTIAVCKN